MKNYAVVALLLALSIATLGGCKPKQPAGNANNGNPPIVEPPVNIDPPQDACGPKPGRGPAPAKDALTGFSAKLEGDCLHMKYSYSGGCKTHDVNVYWDGNWAESIPPQTHLYLSHNANGDACEAIKQGETLVDMKELRYAGVGQVIVDLHPISGSVIRLNYTYSDK